MGVALPFAVSSAPGAAAAVCARPIELRAAPQTGFSEFYVCSTGVKFTPRGANYWKLDPVTHEHNTFRVDGATQDYTDYQNAVTALDYMRNRGYNVVRVFLAHRQIQNPNGTRTLDPLYLRNVADFVNAAYARGIYVMLTASFLPTNADGKTGPWVPTLAERAPGSGDESRISRVNAYYLDSVFIERQREYIRALVTGLRAQGADLRGVFSYGISNEAFFPQLEPPFTLTCCSQTTATGVYSVPSQNELMMDDNTVNWVAKMREALRTNVGDPAYVPEAAGWIAVGIFSPEASDTYRSATRNESVRSAAIIRRSVADVVDAHLYFEHARLEAGEGTDGVSTRMQEHFRALGVGGYTMKPLIMGEFGHRTGEGQTPTASAAATYLRDWQVASCNTNLISPATYGKFLGWLTYTWDTTRSTSTTSGEHPTNLDYWNHRDSSWAIDNALNPVNRPNACTP